MLIQMANIFTHENQQALICPLVARKRRLFQTQIRQTDRNLRLRQLRQINLTSGGPCIQSLVQSLPNSLSDTVQFLTQNIRFQKCISRLIVNRIFQFQLKDQQSDKIYRLFNEAIPSTKKQLYEQFYLLNVIFDHQGIWAQRILKRYFLIVFEHVKFYEQFALLFKSLNIVIGNVDLNWVPIHEISFLLRHFEESKWSQISNPQVETYELVSKNYIKVIQENQQIRYRIKQILQRGSQLFLWIQPKTYFKLCISLTYHEGSTDPDRKSQQDQLFFHSALLKGGIYRAIFRQVTFAASIKLRLLGLNLLRNLICEFGSQILWRQQKLNPIQHFQSQIKDKHNDIRTFQTYTQIFLLSILKIPYKELLQNVIHGQIDSLNLILYILQNVQETKKEIRELAVQCLLLFLNQHERDDRYKIANILSQNQWRNLLIQENQLYDKITEVLGQTP